MTRPVRIEVLTVSVERQAPGTAAPPAPRRDRAREIRAGEAKGRAASCTSTMRGRLALQCLEARHEPRLAGSRRQRRRRSSARPGAAAANRARSSGWMTGCTTAICGWRAKGSKSMADHRLACEGAVLLGYVAAGARPAAGRDDHGSNFPGIGHHTGMRDRLTYRVAARRKPIGSPPCLAKIHDIAVQHLTQA